MEKDTANKASFYLNVSILDAEGDPKSFRVGIPLSETRGLDEAIIDMYKEGKDVNDLVKANRVVLAINPANAKKTVNL